MKTVLELAATVSHLSYEYTVKRPSGKRIFVGSFEDLTKDEYVCEHYARSMEVVVNLHKVFIKTIG